ncbi:MAG: AIR synthase-related protein, partial [Bacteroidota bacterium]|nr:AIR synthase-related protein [Bacteroidota bacterium]
SFGRANYEKSYNGGMGSNGLTSARHDVFNKSLASKYPESYDPGTDEAFIYTGNHNLTDKVDGTPLDAGQLLLSPTRTYAPIILEFLKEWKSSVNGMIHCSGGAQTKVLHFVNDVHVIKDNLFSTPPLFMAIQEASGTSWEEMYKVFNMGHRLEVYTNEAAAEALIELSKTFGVEAQIIGRCESSTSGEVTIKSEHGEFYYSNS